MAKRKSRKISKVAEKEIKRLLEDIYCKNCESEDCGVCANHLVDDVNTLYEDLLSCLELED